MYSHTVAPMRLLGVPWARRVSVIYGGDDAFSQERMVAPLPMTANVVVQQWWVLWHVPSGNRALCLSGLQVGLTIRLVPRARSDGFLICRCCASKTRRSRDSNSIIATMFGMIPGSALRAILRLKCICTAKTPAPRLTRVAAEMIEDCLVHSPLACRSTSRQLLPVVIISFLSWCLVSGSSIQGQGSRAGDGQPSGARGRARCHERFQPHGGLTLAHRQGAVQPQRGQSIRHASANM